MGSKPIRFRFRPIDENGNARGFVSKRGIFDGSVLRLGKDRIPLESLLQARQVDRFVQIVARGPAENAIVESTFQVYGSANKRRRLAAAINIAASHRNADEARQKLADLGREAEFRAVCCTACGAMTDLSNCPPSPQVFCVFCGSLKTLDETVHCPAGEKRLRICETCGFYEDARQFLVFYFYFFWVVWGVKEERRHCCSRCMKATAWRMLLYNLIFILGVPTALTQIVRAHFGGVKRDPLFRELARANALARKRKAGQAAALYRVLEERLGVCAGVKFNHGLAWMLAGPQHFDAAADRFLDALGDCGNYWPALDALCHCYAGLGRHEELEQIRQVWGDPVPDAPQRAEEGVQRAAVQV